MLTYVKKRMQSLLAAEARLLHRMGMTPNQVSGMGIFTAFLAAGSYWAVQQNHLFLLIAPILLLLSGFLDALDGAIARLYGEATVFGGFLDSLLDRYADACILVAIMIAGLCSIFWGSVALVGSFLVSYARARGEAAGSRMETIGLAERAERILVLGFASFVAFVRLEALNLGIIVLAVMTNFTVMQRAVHVYKTLKRKES
ncbi:MAG: CDP-alcohol phosphatidyltransferase family protein [Candidatus Bathyarchaeota archaeon]|nr:MAG: CDP-alcohol phosphatidyltransferase family protein [Candidatus Bathyarchaeota archaeon]